jgi:hypothetical protein
VPGINALSPAEARQRFSADCLKNVRFVKAAGNGVCSDFGRYLM